MNEIIQSLLSTVVSDSGPEFSLIFQGFLVYLLLLWVAFCLWVFADARKRYGNIFIALILTLGVFVLNFPALILYLVVRPEEELDYQGGGVEVPVAKFIDENGEVKLSLNLHIHSQFTPNAEMDININTGSDRLVLGNLNAGNKSASKKRTQEKKSWDVLNKVKLRLGALKNRKASKAEVVEVKADDQDSSAAE
jgi:hypothetical protein